MKSGQQSIEDIVNHQSIIVGLTLLTADWTMNYIEQICSGAAACSQALKALAAILDRTYSIKVKWT